MRNIGNKNNKPKNKTDKDLFTLEIWLEKELQYRIVRDCRFNERVNIFTQIDDNREFVLYEIYEWKRQS
jgi:hypothetical protein